MWQLLQPEERPGRAVHDPFVLPHGHIGLGTVLVLGQLCGRVYGCMKV